VALGGTALPPQVHEDLGECQVGVTEPRLSIGRCVFFGIDEGPSKQQNQQFSALSGASSYATGAGQQDITAGTNFFKSLLSGDPTQIAGVLSPAISAEKTSVQQDQKTGAMMGNRSGGTAASNAAASDKVHSDITNLTGNLLGGAASSLTGAGGSLLSSGIAGTQAAYGAAQGMQAQRANMWNDIFKSSASVAGGVISGLPGSPGGWQDNMSNWLGG
jgi:hypothetical protein